MRACRRRGLPVVPVPGPSALTAVLSASGLPTNGFLFVGFLPAKSAARLTFLEKYRDFDYTLALCCALQMWASSFDDTAGTLERYVALCARGGEAAFGNLVTSAGLTSPFDPGSLSRVVARAKDILDC